MHLMGVGNIWLQIFHTFFHPKLWFGTFKFLPTTGNINSKILNNQKTEAKERPIKDHILEKDQILITVAII